MHFIERLFIYRYDLNSLNLSFCIHKPFSIQIHFTFFDITYLQCNGCADKKYVGIYNNANIAEEKKIIHTGNIRDFFTLFPNEFIYN